MELIISSKKKLIDKYGYQNFMMIDFTLFRLQDVLRRDALDSAIVYIDDSTTLRPFGLLPVNSHKADEIKKLLDNIQTRSETNGAIIDYFVIIGGDDIIPFYRIPNPIYDPDGDYDEVVYSDSPYASTDEEYLVPERALGRIPDGNTNNPMFLLNCLESIINCHNKKHNSSGDFGYSAEVWKKASQDVYQAMGDETSRLNYSPPNVTHTLRKGLLNKKKLLYFNLHGSDETVSWYGQPTGQNYLIEAFNANYLNDIDVEQAIVFCEACYGAHIFGKDPNTSLPLKFLEKKVDCFVGSTMIAFGSLVPPISAADVLAKYFFQYVKDGLPYGIAFLNAKQDYAKKMIRLGLFHVDEVDAKTLLEFVLYGDPSLTFEEQKSEPQIIKTEIINGAIVTHYRR